MFSFLGLFFHHTFRGGRLRRLSPLCGITSICQKSPPANSSRSVQSLIQALWGFSSLPALSLQHFGQPRMQHVLRSGTSKSSGEPRLQELLAEVLRRVLHKLLLLRSTGVRCGATNCILGLRQRALSENCQKLLPVCFYNLIFEHWMFCVTGIGRGLLLNSVSKLDIYKRNIWWGSSELPKMLEQPQRGFEGSWTSWT